MDTSPQKRLILIIDSNPDHVQIIQSTLMQSSVNCDIVAIANTKDATNYLHNREQYSNAARPDLILLDLNLGDLQGFDLLTNIKSNPRLKRIPIVVLTLTDDHDIIFNSYALQGNCYVLKPSDLDQFAHTVKRIEEFWLGIVTLPTE